MFGSWRYSIAAPRRWLRLVAAFALVPLLIGPSFLMPTAVSAQQATPCVNCVLYAYTELNLRKAPALDAAVLTFIPKGAAVQRNAGSEINGYAPVTYLGVTGWAVALGLVSSPTEVEPDATPVPTAVPTSTPTPTAVPAPTANQRQALSGLNLRSGPSIDASVIATIPHGGVMTLTNAGAENGYVTVDYGGTTGWVYADLIGPVG